MEPTVECWDCKEWAMGRIYSPKRTHFWCSCGWSIWYDRTQDVWYNQEHGEKRPHCTECARVLAVHTRRPPAEGAGPYRRAS